MTPDQDPRVDAAAKRIQDWKYGPTADAEDREECRAVARAVLAAADAATPPAPAQGDSYEDLVNALHRIDTAAVALPGFRISHEGGLEAVVENIVEAIQRCVATPPAPAVPAGFVLLPVNTRRLIEQCRDALAEELGAWDIDPPLHHVKEAHDACERWLSAAPPAPQQAEGDAPPILATLPDGMPAVVPVQAAIPADAGGERVAFEALRELDALNAVHAKRPRVLSRAMMLGKWAEKHEGVIRAALSAAQPQQAQAQGDAVAWPSAADIADEIDALMPMGLSNSTKAALEEWWRQLVDRKLSKLAPQPTPPAKRLPLTDEQIAAAMTGYGPVGVGFPSLRRIARAIERAHGIGVELGEGGGNG